MAKDTTRADGRLEQRRILVTGAASGIGLAIAELFAREGAALALVDFNAEGLRAVADRLAAAALPLDLAESAAIEPMVEQAAAAMGGLDGVVNCAALGLARSMEETDLAPLWSFTR